MLSYYDYRLCKTTRTLLKGSHQGWSSWPSPEVCIPVCVKPASTRTIFRCSQAKLLSNGLAVSILAHSTYVERWRFISARFEIFFCIASAFSAFSALLRALHFLCAVSYTR